METQDFFKEVKAKVELIPCLSQDSADDKQLVIELLEKAEAGKLIGDIFEIIKHIKTIMSYYGVKINN